MPDAAEELGEAELGEYPFAYLLFAGGLLLPLALESVVLEPAFSEVETASEEALAATTHRAATPLCCGGARDQTPHLRGAISHEAEWHDGGMPTACRAR